MVGVMVWPKIFGHGVGEPLRERDNDARNVPTELVRICLLFSIDYNYPLTVHNGEIPCGLQAEFPPTT